MPPRIVVGLGNPGSEYEWTRHNIGFHVVDELCSRLNVRLTPGKGEYLVANSGLMVVLKPLTYMNGSGQAVAEALERYHATPQDLLIVVDDFALLLGTLRIRTQGSDGGHNGLSSIISHLNSDGFPRLRCGIGKENLPLKEEMVNFVLARFDESEYQAVSAMVKRAADVCMESATEDFARLMNKYNTVT
ncbi:MAG: aminoacyl-tRNA hydrolase [Bacteroidota bacterium]